MSGKLRFANPAPGFCIVAAFCIMSKTLFLHSFTSSIQQIWCNQRQRNFPLRAMQFRKEEKRTHRIYRYKTLFMHFNLLSTCLAKQDYLLTYRRNKQQACSRTPLKMSSVNRNTLRTRCYRSSNGFRRRAGHCTYRWKKAVLAPSDTEWKGLAMASIMPPSLLEAPNDTFHYHIIATIFNYFN